ncbi:MAG TPA: L-seryl-tRNA(Sec) selenium transferase [Gemmatimonadales bacterium]|nr:L-seryl-tRNA(Sec) selenium transferase [Gemmatimonadales bacterium]
MSDPRRALPSVDRLLRDPSLQPLLAVTPRDLVADAAREALDAARRQRAGVPEDWAGEIRERVERRSAQSLRPAINATGVVLHTNLGRAPLAAAAIEAVVAAAAGYSTLEFDLHTGTRGHRSDHCRALLAALTGAPDALVVNNAAGALVLSLNALAAGRPVLISRGELIEIGGAFRIPEIMQKSGAELREIGTTNRTHLKDYRDGLELGAGAILTVHRSNFEQVGFVHTPAPAELAALAREFGVPFLYDVGSGLLADLAGAGLTGEPLVRDAVAIGADLVLFSGDKLLGGPQAGCMVGSRDAVERCRKNPLARAVRADKLTLAGLDATLRLYQDPAVALREIPVLAMLTRTADQLEQRARALAQQLPIQFAPEVIPGESAVGGGSFPAARLKTWLVALTPGAPGAESFALRLRLGATPVVARVQDGRLLLDPRTIAGSQMELVVQAVRQVATQED